MGIEPGLVGLPGVVRAAFQAQDGRLPLVQEGLHQDVTLLVLVENELDVGGKGGIAPAGPVQAFLGCHALRNPLQPQAGAQRQHVVVVAEAEVCGGFPCGDGGIGPFNDILDGGIYGRHAVVAVLHGVALAKVEAQDVNLVVGQQVLVREQAEDAVPQFKGGAAYSHVKGL